MNRCCLYHRNRRHVRIGAGTARAHAGAHACGARTRHRGTVAVTARLVCRGIALGVGFRGLQCSLCILSANIFVVATAVITTFFSNVVFRLGFSYQDLLTCLIGIFLLRLEFGLSNFLATFCFSNADVLGVARH